MKEYLVSVIVPCYNSGKYLSETLDSVLHQTYPNWECVIVNDGSSDCTEEISKHYCNIDPRFKYIYQINQGLSSARNTGILNSQGKFVLPLDSDDKVGSRYLELAVDAFRNNPRVRIVYSRAMLFGKRKGEWRLPEYSFERMLARNCIYCSALYKREDYDKSGGYNSNMKYGYEDWDFWLSILNKNDEVYKIDDIQFYYRIRKKSMARSLDLEKIKFLRKQLWRNHRELYAQYSFDITETFEYRLISDSYEYKIGKLLLKPLRFILRIL